jgi:hypothetical protein
MGKICCSDTLSTENPIWNGIETYKYVVGQNSESVNVKAFNTRYASYRERRLWHEELIDIKYDLKSIQIKTLIVTLSFILPTPCIGYVFRRIVSVNSEYFPAQHSPFAL